MHAGLLASAPAGANLLRIHRSLSQLSLHRIILLHIHHSSSQPRSSADTHAGHFALELTVAKPLRINHSLSQLHGRPVPYSYHGRRVSTTRIHLHVHHSLSQPWISAETRAGPLALALNGGQTPPCTSLVAPALKLMHAGPFLYWHELGPHSSVYITHYPALWLCCLTCTPFVLHRHEQGPNFGGRQNPGEVRFIFKKAHMSNDDFRIFNAQGRLICNAWHQGKNPVRL